MECYRICIITALAVCTAALTCSALFPLFRRVDDGVTNGIYYWYTDNSTTADNTVHISRVYTRHLSCSQAKTFFIVSCAASTVGATLGFLAVLLSVAHLHAIRKSCFSVLVAVCTMVACLCSATCVALTAVMYGRTVCPNTVGQIQYKADSFHVREGFILACVACGGFLIAFVFHLLCRMSGKADA